MINSKINKSKNINNADQEAISRLLLNPDVDSYMFSIWIKTIGDRIEVQIINNEQWEEKNKNNKIIDKQVDKKPVLYIPQDLNIKRNISIIISITNLIIETEDITFSSKTLEKLESTMNIFLNNYMELWDNTGFLSYFEIYKKIALLTKDENIKNKIEKNANIIRNKYNSKKELAELESDLTDADIEDRKTLKADVLDNIENLLYYSAVEHSLEQEQAVIFFQKWVSTIKKRLYDEIEIDQYKKKLEDNKELKYEEKIKIINNLIYKIKSYPYKSDSFAPNWAFDKNIDWQNTDINCLWRSYIWHMFLDELWISHKIIRQQWHIAILLDIDNNKYLFDATNFDHIIKIKKDEIKKINNKFSNIKYKFTTLEVREVWITGVKRTFDDPNEWLMSDLLLWIWAMETDLDKKIKFFDDAIKVDKENEDMHYFLWKALQEKWEYQKAIEQYKLVLESYELDYAYKNIADCYKKMWKYYDAFLYYQKELVSIKEHIIYDQKEDKSNWTYGELYMNNCFSNKDMINSIQATKKLLNYIKWYKQKKELISKWVDIEKVRIDCLLRLFKNDDTSWNRRTLQLIKIYERKLYLLDREKKKIKNKKKQKNPGIKSKSKNKQDIKKEKAEEKDRNIIYKTKKRELKKIIKYYKKKLKDQ